MQMPPYPVLPQPDTLEGPLLRFTSGHVPAIQS